MTGLKKSLHLSICLTLFLYILCFFLSVLTCSCWLQLLLSLPLSSLIRLEQRKQKCRIYIILKLCIVFALSLQIGEALFILSQKHFLQNSNDDCLYSHHLFPWQYTVFVRRNWICRLVTGSYHWLILLPRSHLFSSPAGPSHLKTKGSGDIEFLIVLIAYWKTKSYQVIDR